jgi:16S rRNA (cytosine967-C5)-methyltransferase
MRGKPVSPRAVALGALQRWRQRNEFADAIIQHSLASSELSASNRAFALELFYGVLRNLTLLDFWIDCLRHGKTEKGVRDLLQLGLYQIFLLDTAEHAAVFETVELAPKRQRPLVNGVLRAALREKQDLSERASAQPLSTQWSHPPWLLARWNKHFGAKAALDLCLWDNRPAPLYARVNRLKKSVPEFLRENPGSFLLPTHENFVHLPGVPATALARGDCYIQDPSTSIACRLLDPRPDERILDACAAPGGKSAYIAELMQNRGEIVACDRDGQRLQILRENLDRLGATRVRVIQHDWLRRDMVGPTFDRILLDAPCTNTGVMRRRVDVRWRLRPEDLDRMHNEQIEIARRVPLLKPGGIFVYSTCSLEREENEDIVEQLGREFRTLRLEKIETVLPFRDGFDGAFAARFVRRDVLPHVLSSADNQ